MQRAAPRLWGAAAGWRRHLATGVTSASRGRGSDGPASVAALARSGAGAYVGGGGQPGAPGAPPLVVHNPYTGGRVATLSDGGAPAAAAATAAAAGAATAWAATPTANRAAAVGRWADALDAAAGDLAAVLVAEGGKTLADAAAEVAYATSYLRYYATAAAAAHVEAVTPIDLSDGGGGTGVVTKEPVGVVAAITPWNFPLAMLARKVAPAVLAGCTVVAKPAAETPLSALALARLAPLPPGVVNVVATADAAAVGDTWMAAGAVRKVTFTGSTGVGVGLARAAAGTGKRVSLELGGLAPLIVTADADLPAAVGGLLAARLRCSGQTCISPGRVYVHRSVVGAFASALADGLAAAAAPGDPAVEPPDGATRVGPLIHSGAVHKVQALVRDALDGGATLVTGGTVVPAADGGGDAGHVVTPALLTGVTDRMRLFQEEAFGPVFPLSPFDTLDEVVGRANSLPVGLAAYVYAGDPATGRALAARLQAGMVGVGSVALSDARVPFGGVRLSGVGREGGLPGLDPYLELKYTLLG